MLHNRIRSNKMAALCRRAQNCAVVFSRRFRSTKTLPSGTFPTMLTPFRQDMSIDWIAFDNLVEWYIANNADGLFAVCQSSEMLNLSNEERLQIVKRVAKTVNARVPVIAGATFEGSLEEQAEFMSEVGKHVNAPVVLTNQIASFEQSDTQWMLNAETLLKLTGDIPLAIYETPVPKCRALTPEMVGWIAKTKRFVFLKDPVADVKVMKQKIEAARSVVDTPLKYYTSKLALLSSCLEYGGHGFSGITLNFFPHLITWFCHNQDSNSEQLMSLQRMFSLAEAVAYRKYPASAKYYVAKFYGVPMKPLCRTVDITLEDFDKMALKHMNSALDEFQHSLERF